MTIVMTKTMLLIGTPLVETCWKNLIDSWRFWKFHGWRHCGTHLSPRLNRQRIISKKYFDGGMTFTTLLIFPIDDSIVSVLIFFEVNASLM